MEVNATLVWVLHKSVQLTTKQTSKYDSHRLFVWLPFGSITTLWRMGNVTVSEHNTMIML